MRSTCLTASVLVLTLTGCQRSSPAPDLSPADIAAIRATSDRWMAAVHAGRWDDAAATYTADAIVWLPSAVYEGRVAIRRFLETMQPLDPTRTLHIDEIRGRGDMAFVSGHSTIVPAGGGLPVELARYLDVRLRQADGSWLFYRDMVSPVPRPTESR
jgi:uncharacterized protein (TIGR02246 family)